LGRLANIDGDRPPRLDARTGMVTAGPPVADLDVDIILDDAPTGIALMDEQFALLVQLKQFDAKGELPLKTLIQAAPNLRGKQELLRGIEEASAAPPDPLMVEGAQAEVAEKQAGAAERQSAAMRNLAQAQRMQAELAAMGVAPMPMGAPGAPVPATWPQSAAEQGMVGQAMPGPL
jgi:hypothetical protein